MLEQAQGAVIDRNDSDKPIKNRILVATPTLGIVRFEWASARWGQVQPPNWTCAGMNVGVPYLAPVGYLVAEAQNIAVDFAVRNNFEWLFLIEDDVILPADAFLKLNDYMKDGTIPVVSGLYYLKANPSEPLVYRGRGNSCFFDFKIGDKVWVDGVPTGCLLIHGSILKLMWEESEEYPTSLDRGRLIKKVFETPAKVFIDPETKCASSAMGTSDLYWCDRVMREKVLQRAGWKEIGEKEYPFLIDTSMFCKHIDLSTGTQYPLNLPLTAFKAGGK